MHSWRGVNYHALYMMYSSPRVADIRRMSPRLFVTTRCVWCTVVLVWLTSDECRQGSLFQVVDAYSWLSRFSQICGRKSVKLYSRPASRVLAPQSVPRRPWPLSVTADWHHRITMSTSLGRRSSVSVADFRRAAAAAADYEISILMYDLSSAARLCVSEARYRNCRCNTLSLRNSVQ